MPTANKDALPNGEGIMPERPPFRPPAQPPLAAQVMNRLCTRAQPWGFSVQGTACTLEAAPFAPFRAVAAVDVECGGGLWRLELGSLRFLALHPALASVEPGAVLPPELQLAVLEVLLAPVLAAAQAFMGTPLVLRASRFVEAASGDQDAGGARLCSVPLLLTVGTGKNAYPVPVRLDLPDRDSVPPLVERLEPLPCRRAKGLAASLPVILSVEAGRMRLSLREAADLHCGDILLPERYPARDGRLALRLGPPDAPFLTFACSVSGSEATILSAYNAAPEEEPMSETTPSPETPPSAAPQDSLDVGELEVTLTFELERRRLTVRDVETLAPGYVFALGGDALSPVTLCANGKAIGTGRLVDLGGTLGVQITRLDTGGEQA
ncbi:type III secretion system cytoplasmic ring protein SctQ [uncultured Bilophila sp.]|uniref:type III secretion system cytoplasmic ring protein SctQ n=1 Tax=uncultured Bilophila sp. TaxID=529385 RepID=UPI0026169814|nr:type III secretion system cytoplasmic ring protein SctQ [uncultured Bilophila sp.]